MARSIVFLNSVPFTDVHARRYGLRVLKDKGITIHFIDLSRLLNGAVNFQDDEGCRFEGINIYLIDSYLEFEKKIKELSETSIFAEFLVSLSGIDIKHEKIFRILKKYRAKYYVIHDADLPTHLVKEGGSKKEFLERLLRRLSLRWLNHYITRVVLRVLTKFGFYPLPVKVFGTRSENVKNYIRKFKNSRIPLIPINSSDYSVYLEYVRNNKGSIPPADKTCIFLDEDAVHSYDFDILKAKKIDGPRYLNAMNQLFKKIETETGLEVIIAAHPMSHYEECPGAFDNRRIIKGKTVDLVAKSSLVVLHASTAVSYAVLFNKPVLIVKTYGLIQAKRDFYIDAFAKELGVASVNIEDKKQLEELSLNLENFSNTHFSEYKYKYLASEEVEHLTTWEIIAEELSKEPTLV